MKTTTAISVTVFALGISTLSAQQMRMDGQGTFGTIHVILEMGDYANGIFLTDVDGDNDMDVFSASPYINEVAWFENLDGQGTFGSKNIITNPNPPC